MLEQYRDELISITREFSEKELKKYKVNNLINLSSKLHAYTDADVEELMLELKNELSGLQSEEGFNKKRYNKTFVTMATIVKERFDLHEKGSVSGYYLSIGIALGAGIGTALSSVLAGNIGIGIGCGVAIGAGIGNTKEKKLEEEGKIY
jgi:hypothetical protein